MSNKNKNNVLKKQYGFNGNCFSINEPVIHIKHGIGRYAGLKTIKTSNIIGEYLVISYAENSKLYVPVTSFHLISRFKQFSNNSISLHKLGNNKWIKEKKKISKNIHDTAAILLKIHATRKLKKGFSFKEKKKKYKEFCKSFPFQLTKDQFKAINEVKRDMKKTTPMDRLICGEVGFGKTEIAIRASFLAISNKKQVAILVPTTLLAQQHYAVFSNRFSSTNFKISIISRFSNSKKIKKIKKNIKKGKINILIGTHIILFKKIIWKNLGLLIIDEEHRFGVLQKELIQTKFPLIDILTLTATPIPRTLNMVMNGLRDLSIISTPPDQRKTIKTFIREKNNTLIKKIILKEINRGGQVYYLYNKVKKINKKAKIISMLVPEAKIQIGHGKMCGKQLKEIMKNFYEKKFNVLICTTIIETGIDVPYANTIIIEHADYFGLAQLHQLRGRVGRSNIQAYAWLFVKNLKKISKNSTKRLKAIASSKNFGAGFLLSTHDLEIRGVGEILGNNQSGYINSIGSFLYLSLLKKTIKMLKKNKTCSLDSMIYKHPEIDIKISALIPEDYIKDVHYRLFLYKEISNFKDLVLMKKFLLKIKKKFGNFPTLFKNFIKLSQIRIIAKKNKIHFIKLNKQGGFIKFKNINLINLKKVIAFFSLNPTSGKIENNKNQLQFYNNSNIKLKKIKWMFEILKKITKKK